MGKRTSPIRKQVTQLLVLCPACSHLIKEKTLSGSHKVCNYCGTISKNKLFIKLNVLQMNNFDQQINQYKDYLQKLPTLPNLNKLLGQKKISNILVTNIVREFIKKSEDELVNDLLFIAEILNLPYSLLINDLMSNISPSHQINPNIIILLETLIGLNYSKVKSANLIKFDL